MKHRLNENGVTLIEVLATLTILSLLTGIVYGVFINGINYSNKARETVSIQQEANYLLTLLKEQHEKQALYNIKISTDNRQINITNSDNESFLLNNEEFLYNIYQCDTTNCYIQNNFSVNPKKKNEVNIVDNVVNVNGAFHLQIVIEKAGNPNQNVKIKTVLSRL